MKIRLFSIWRFVPVPVIVVRRLPGRIVGLCMGPVILLRSDHAQDWPTIVHELAHCKQFWRGGAVIHLYRYLTNPTYRMHSEVEAYLAEVAACRPEEQQRRLHDSARALAAGYGLGVDAQRCRVMLLAAGARQSTR